MEINPRLSASVEIAVRSGVDFTYLLYQWASGGPIETVTGYRTGTWMRYLLGDIMTTIAAARQRGRPGVPPPARAMLDFGLAFFQPMGYDCADWTDPLPAVKAAANFMRQSVKVIGRTLPRSWKRSEEHTSELQSLRHLVCRLLLEKKKKNACKRERPHKEHRIQPKPHTASPKRHHTHRAQPRRPYIRSRPRHAPDHNTAEHPTHDP